MCVRKRKCTSIDCPQKNREPQRQQNLLFRIFDLAAANMEPRFVACKCTYCHVHTHTRSISAPRICIYYLFIHPSIFIYYLSYLFVRWVVGWFRLFDCQLHRGEYKKNQIYIYEKWFVMLSTADIIFSWLATSNKAS